jgi:hypothetical protein
MYTLSESAENSLQYRLFSAEKYYPGKKLKNLRYYKKASKRPEFKIRQKQKKKLGNVGVEPQVPVFHQSGKYLNHERFHPFLKK